MGSIIWLLLVIYSMAKKIESVKIWPSSRHSSAENFDGAVLSGPLCSRPILLGTHGTINGHFIDPPAPTHRRLAGASSDQTTRSVLPTAAVTQRPNLLSTARWYSCFEQLGPLRYVASWVARMKPAQRAVYCRRTGLWLWRCTVTLVLERWMPSTVYHTVVFWCRAGSDILSLCFHHSVSSADRSFECNIRHHLPNYVPFEFFSLFPQNLSSAPGVAPDFSYTPKARAQLM